MRARGSTTALLACGLVALASLVASAAGEKQQEQDFCALWPIVGDCRASIPQYFFNSTSGACEVFYWGGCGGNANRFGTVEACSQTCLGRAPARITVQPGGDPAATTAQPSAGGGATAARQAPQPARAATPPATGAGGVTRACWVLVVTLLAVPILALHVG